jgi:hypothetical protein
MPLAFNNLTTALALLAVAVLLGLALQGWWRARQLQSRRAKQALPLDADAPADPARAAGRVEPGLDTAEGTTGPSLDAADTQPDLALQAWHAQRRQPRLDALIDAIAPLALEAPLSGDFLLQHLPASRRAGSKAFYLEGLAVDGSEFEPLAPGRRYRELQAGVQLASRSGALNQIEYSEFVQKLQAYADAVVATPDFPDMLEVAARARELDHLASPLDVQLAVRLRSDTVAWSVAYVAQVAARHGFVPGALPGRLVLPGAEDGDPPVLVLQFDAQAALAEDAQQAVVRECTLSLDVPQTAEALEPFPLWHRSATALCDDMGAVTLDDAGQPLTLHAFAHIGRDLGQLYQQLAALDLAAGSAAARRLFS